MFPRGVEVAWFRFPFQLLRGSLFTTLDGPFPAFTVTRYEIGTVRNTLCLSR